MADQSVRMDLPDVARRLQQTLGHRLVATISGSRDPKAIGGWIDGSRHPHLKVEQRLRAAVQAINQLPTGRVTKTWFEVNHPDLDYDTPPEALAADRLKEVVQAARRFGRDRP